MYMYIHKKMLKIQSGNIIETFDVKENKWTRLKDLTLHRLEYGVNIINNKLLIIGGSDGKQRVDTVRFFHYL